MDWCIESSAPDGLANGASEIESYFRRHALPTSWEQLRAGVAESLTAVATGNQFVWARVDWDHEAPELIVRPVDATPAVSERLQADDAVQVAPGVHLANGFASDLGAAAGRTEVRRRFDLAREPEVDIDPGPTLLRPAPDDLSREAFLAAVALSATVPEASTDPAARAAQAGAELSVAALAAYLRRTGQERPGDASQAASAFLALQRAAGADFYLVEADEDHAVLANRRCPFGSGVTAAPMLCRCTSSVLGRLGAEAAGEAWVTMPERIALGDPECRAVLQLGPMSQPSPISHRYADPPAGLIAGPAPEDGARLDGDPRVVLSLLLPRDAGSVPVVRHMCEQVVGALGATAEAVGDLSVALTEACSNVVRHAHVGDDFRVEVELGGDRCEIVVSYRDTAFDPGQVGVAVGDEVSESGRGLILMRALVDELDFTFDPGRTSVRMVKHLVFAEERPIQRLLRPKQPPPS